jgi:hypothetical protein
MGRRHQDMWKLRLSILLPAVQLPLAVIRWEWGARSTIRLLALVIGGLAHSFVMGSMLPLFFLDLRYSHSHVMGARGLTHRYSAMAQKNWLFSWV